MADKKEQTEINWPEGTSREKREELQPVLEAFESALEEFEKDHKVIFRSDAERNRLFFGNLKRWSKAWSKPGLCMYDGCTAKSIARSHTIPLSSSIRLIAEDGHVVTPKFGGNGVELVPIGVNEASTFPGFCEEHEALFSDFEVKKSMTEPEHFLLQAFRTICREIYTKRHYKRRSEDMLAEYRRLRDGFIVDRIQQALDGKTPINVGNPSFQNDPMEKRLIESLDEIGADIAALEELYRDILDEYRNGTDKVAMVVSNFDIQLDVCLSGLGVLNYMERGERKRALCFLAIVPELEQTKIIIGATAAHQGAIHAHVQDVSSPVALEMLESWMMHGSDHWFMTPSSWAAIPAARQRAICDRILETSWSLADVVPFSVVDGARRRIIESIEASLADGSIAPADLSRVQEILANEKSKLGYVPNADT